MPAFSPIDDVDPDVIKELDPGYAQLYSYYEPYGIDVLETFGTSADKSAEAYKVADTRLRLITS